MSAKVQNSKHETADLTFPAYFFVLSESKSYSIMLRVHIRVRASGD